MLSALLGLVPSPLPVSSVATPVLSPCPNTANCVSTESTRPSQRVPVVAFVDAPESAQRRARAALLAEPRSKVTVERDGYIKGECRSFLFRFTDDVEIVVDATAKVFRFRSASRVGRSDLGVNRKRVLRLSERLTTAGAS